MVVVLAIAPKTSANFLPNCMLTMNLFTKHHKLRFAQVVKKTPAKIITNETACWTFGIGKRKKGTEQISTLFSNRLNGYSAIGCKSTTKRNYNFNNHKIIQIYFSLQSSCLVSMGCS